MRMTTSVENFESVRFTNLQSATRLLKSILQKAFTGNSYRPNKSITKLIYANRLSQK